jgi:hypothetical protein
MRRKLIENARKPFVPVLSLLLLALLVVWLGTLTPANLTAGDNLDMQPVEGGPIFDLRWDPRLFAGGGFIEWFHNTANLPINQTAFEAELETAFNNWEAVGALTGAPDVPEVNKASTTTAADPTALDGINTVGWAFVDPFGGFLARAPCYFLTADTTTVDVGGQTHLPTPTGSIPFPGAVGVTYPPGTAVDCWMEFDAFDSWSTAAGPVAGQFDVQSVGTHEGGHFLGESHSTVGLALGLNAETATMVPAGSSNNIDLRSLAEDDIASLIRTYARNATPPVVQTAGGRGLIQFTLGKGAACEPATGVSVWAYEAAGGIDGANRVETFSGSQFQDPLGDPYNGSVKLNVPPGGPYTVYARTLEDNGTSSAGLYSAFRYSNTTINSNSMEPNALTQEFDNIASVATIAAGQTVDLGTVGILGCWVPVATSNVDIEVTASAAAASATLGGQIVVTSSFTNVGTAAAGPFEVGFYFSSDATINTDDAFSGFTCSIGGLGVGASDSCDGTIDVPAVAPGTYFVGALADIQNVIVEDDESNNALATPPQVAVSSDPLNPIVNGSFEDNGGGFHGWNIKELSRASNPQLPLTIAGSTLGGSGIQYPAPAFQAGNWILDYFDSEPTDGSWAAVHDFNGDDQGTISSTLVNRRELYQDLTLPAGTTTLEFDYRAAWELYRFGATQPRTFSVEIQPAGGGAPLLSQIILNATHGDEPPGGAGFEEDTDNPTGVVDPYPDGIADLSAFAGQDVRLMFVWNIPEPATGFAFFQLDNVRLNATVIPVTDIGITAINAPASVDEGDLTPVTVTVQNLGNQNVTDNIAVTLSPDAGGGTVTTNPQTIVGGLAVGASTQVLFSWDSAGATAGLHTLTAAHGFSDGSAANNSLGTSVTVNAAPVTDIAISSLSAPSSVNQGDGVAVNVTVENIGNQDVTDNIMVTLTPDAAGGTVTDSPQTILGGLAVGVSANLTFNWDTTGATTILHTLTVAHGYGDDNLGNNSANTMVTVNTPPPPIVDNLTNADFSTPQGTIVGSHVDTHVQDNSYEELTETQQGKKKKVRSSLAHTWTANVAAGASYMFKLDAYHTPNSEGDNFVFSYSTDNSTFNNMLTVTKTADDDVEQTFTFPGDVAGTLYIRVVDTNNSQGNGGVDTLFVDSIVVTTATSGTDIFPPGAPTGLTALGSDGNVSLDWDDNTEPDLDGYRVFRSTTSGAGYAPIGPLLVGVSDFQDNTVVNGTTYFYIVTAVDTTGNESDANAEASATPDVAGSATSVHVASLVASSVRERGNRRRGRAVAVIVDNLGSPVGSVTVTGTFSGDFNQPQSDVTNGSGSATMDTSNTVKGNVNFTFCVDSVTGGLPYQAGDNVVTCDSL